jgi:DNA-binding GntR family transcriptional regulator
MNLTITKIRHVADAILSDISTGHLRNFDHIESERKLTQVFGVSLGTAHRAPCSAHS